MAVLTIQTIRDTIAGARKLAPSLQVRGWSWEAVDLCWMRCSRPGYRKTRERNEIGDTEELVLCAPHALEHEAEQVLLAENPHFPFIRDEWDPTPEQRWWPWRPVTTEYGEVEQ